MYYIYIILFRCYLNTNFIDDYFAPIMETISKLLNLSDSVAGVTFLAFGNGAPDISSSVTAIVKGGNTAKLGLGALLGAAVFDAIAVSGVIAIVCVDPDVAKRPFGRDIIFLFLSGLGVFLLTLNNQIRIQGAIGLIGTYILYVSVVMFGEFYKKWKIKQMNKSKPDIETPKMKDKIVANVGAIFSNESMTNILKDDDPIKPQNGNIHIENNELKDDNFVVSKESSDDDDGKQNIYTKILILTLKGPTLIVDFLCWITIPKIDEESWNDKIAIISCILTPLLFIFSWEIYDIDIFEGDNFTVSVWWITLIFGIVMAIVTALQIKVKYAMDKQIKLSSQQTLLDQSNIMDSPVANGQNSLYDSIGGGSIKTLDSSLMNSSGSLPVMESIKSQNKSFKKTSISQIYEETPSKPKPSPKPKPPPTPIKKYSEIDPKTQPVFKYFFLVLSFMGAISWIAIVADELINILTTLGVVSTIDLAILGLTVLAWGI